MQIFFDINSDGQPLGRIAVELFNDVPIGSLRFQELAEGHEGISYQLSKFNEIGPVSHCLLDSTCTICLAPQAACPDVSVNTRADAASVTVVTLPTSWPSLHSRLHDGNSFLLQGFIRVADLQSLTYAAEKAASIAGGETVEQLEVRRLMQHSPLLVAGLDAMPLSWPCLQWA